MVPRAVAASGSPSQGLPEGTVLQATGLEKRYGSGLPFDRDVEVLTGADIELAAGEVVGIVGENGSGKSTLMQILVGALSADAGEVKRAGSVGWCPQEPLLYDRLTVTETFAVFGEAYGMDTDAVEAARDRLAETLGFEEYVDYRIDHLSGGNRQKVNLAISVMHDPAILLLDEPYTGFDWETYLSFWKLTESLVDQGVAVAVISHLINERDRFDRVLELREGRLSEQPATEAPDADGVDR
ncbi:MAG: ABC transporter ATP-binding protein [Halobacteriaceae archaeon]